MKKQVAIIALSLFSVAGAVQAEGSVPWIDTMMQADTNHDGALTMEEITSFTSNDTSYDFASITANHFETYDANHDGMVTMEEVRAYNARNSDDIASLTANKFQTYDSNHDGMVTMDEVNNINNSEDIASLTANQFNTYDTDNDGMVTMTELKAGSGVR